MNVDDIRKHFSFYKHNKNLYYLDSAASSLKLDLAIDKMTDYYHKSGVNIHRGNYELAFFTTKEYEESRNTVAEFINAEPKEIIFTKGATQALNLVANSASVFVEEGDEIITTELEHNSSILPWLNQESKLRFKTVYIPLDSEYKVTVENFKKVLTKKTKVVVINHVSNVLGYITPIKEITKLAHEVGAVVILDAAQSIPHMKIDVKELGIDFLAFSGHKIFGPTGIGVLYGKKEMLEKLKVYEVGGEMVAKATKDNIVFQDIPYRFEAGTPPIGEAIGLAAAIKYVNSIGFDNTSKHIENLRLKAVRELSKIKGVVVYNPNGDAGIISFNIKGVHPHDASSVYDEKNVLLRSGHHCASILTEVLKTPGGTLRASISIYNNEEDIDKLVEATKEAAEFFRRY